MTKKNFRSRWEPYFSQFNDAELVAVQLWVKRMYENGEWYGYCGRIADAMNRVIKLDRREELLAEIGDASSEIERLEHEALH
ncbi:MAG: hypothetical protein QF535_00975 [Anaerolineales bacterium]|jgi:hypothetical protein|nr:hypothetical protein [Anaerolineales bacterium]